MKHYLFITLLIAVLPWQGAQSACTAANPNAQMAETTPTAEFTDNGDGTVTHDRTGLTWKRCSEEQTWNGTSESCEDPDPVTLMTMTWPAALAAAKSSSFAGHSDWRLPTLKELASIVETCGYFPAINQTIFPNTASSNYWSASTYVPDPADAWLVNFSNGYDDAYFKTYNGYYVRLVRGGQWLDPFDAQGDWAPDAFSFTAQVDADLNTSYTSESAILAGLTTVTGISVSGGEYAAGSACGGSGGREIAWTTTPGVVENGDTVCVRLTSSGMTTTATLTVGGVSADFDVTTAKMDQTTLTVTGPSSLTFGGTGSITTSGGTGTGALSYDSGSSTGCSVNATTGVITVTDASGACAVTATKATDANYNAATSAAYTVTLNKAAQATLTVIGPSSLTFGGTESITTSGGTGTGALSYDSGSSTGCSVNATTGVISVTDASGACAVTATQAADANYNEATSAAYTVTLNKAAQAISFGPAPSVVVGGTGSVTATGGGSGNSVSFTSQTTGVCTVSGSTVTGVTAGTCTVAANQAGNANYNAAPQVTQNITVGKGSQTITFGAAPSVVVNGTGTVSATGGASANSVTFTSQTTGVCTISGGTVTGVTAGTCTLAANQAGNANYNAAPQVTQNITVGKGDQSIAFGAAPSLVVDGTGTVSATGGASGNAITFTSQTTGVCTVSGGMVTGVTAGTCTIAANQAGNANYNAAPQVTQNITVGKGSQSITFGAAPSVVVEGTGTVSATGGASANSVTFTSQTTGVCTISGSTVTGVTAGTCTVAANQAGNANYNAAPQVTQNITVGKGSQTITFGAAPSVVVNGTGTVSATGGASGNSVTFTSQTTGVCTISGGTVTGVTAGTCTVAANQAGSANYNAAPQVTQNITVGKASQTITFGAAPSVVVDGTGTVSATGGASGNAITFTSQTTGVCTVSGGMVTGVTAGTCTIAANQAGNANYNAAPQVTQNITVGKGSQTITFGAAPSVVVEGTGTVSATGGASANSVTFTSQTTGVCTISGSTVTGVTAGTCTVAANQAGSANYNAASQVTQNITVGKGSQTITFGAAPSVVVNGTGTVSATGGASANAVTFTSQTTGVCMISGSTVTGVSAGTCTIAANQAGNTDYNPAPEVTQDLEITEPGGSGGCSGTGPVDLSLHLHRDIAVPAPGDSLRYSVRVHNNSCRGASNVSVDLGLPAGVTLVSTIGCDEDPAAVPSCTLGHLSGYQSHWYRVDVQVDAGAGSELLLSGTAATSSDDRNLDNNSAALSTTVGQQTDTDGDGMPDEWEDANGLWKGDSLDASLDLDRDGLNSLEEYQAGTDPNNPDTDGDGMPDGSDPDPLNPPCAAAGDCDGDGLADDWEARYGGGLDPDADNDGDGLSNREEQQYGTHPLRADTDGDELDDQTEIFGNLGTDVLDNDTDADGLLDGWDNQPLVMNPNACSGDQILLDAVVYRNGEEISCRAQRIELRNVAGCEDGARVGLVADQIQVPADGLWVEPGCRFHLVTPEAAAGRSHAP